MILVEGTLYVVESGNDRRTLLLPSNITISNTARRQVHLRFWVLAFKAWNSTPGHTSSRYQYRLLVDLNHRCCSFQILGSAAPSRANFPPVGSGCLALHTSCQTEVIVGGGSKARPVQPSSTQPKAEQRYAAEAQHGVGQSSRRSEAHQPPCNSMNPWGTGTFAYCSLCGSLVSSLAHVAPCGL